MIRALLVDLGETLVSNRVLLPGVASALEAIAKIETGLGTLRLGLVSDWEDPDPVGDPIAIAESVARYVKFVEQLGILRFFSPPNGAITLSTQVGVRKPDVRLFERALQELGLGAAGLAAAMFITENRAHVEAARGLGLAALQFGITGDFSSWHDAPALIAAHIHAPGPGESEDSETFERTLRENDLVAREGEVLGPGRTHEEETDGGRPRRRRFSSH